ncbi:MAG TPA: hypothetical protein VGA03_02150 [Anaerolineales bacterium]
MRTRSSLASAFVLIAIGAWFLSVELFPQVKTFAYGRETWPLPIIGIGVLLVSIGLITWVPGLFIPAAIVSGIGGLLYWQNATGNWESWAYAWALIPGFVGVGMLLSGLLGRERRTVTAAGWMIFISIMLFAIFGSFLGGLGLFSQYWPVLVILLGVMLLAKGLFRWR